MLFQVMNAAAVAQIIQLIIAPTVMLSVCSLIQSGVLARYIALGSRIRSLNQERFRLLHDTGAMDALSVASLKTLDYQIPLLIRRHRLLQDTVLIIYVAIGILIVSMFAIALSVAINSSMIARFALVLFLVSAGALLCGVCLTAQEVRISHQALCYEVRQISILEDPQLEAKQSKV